MERKLKPRVWVMTSLYALIIICISVGTFLIVKNLNKNSNNKTNDNYVSETITNDDVPTISEVDKMLRPYTDTKVTIGKSYYDYQKDATSQEKSIIYHDNTYMQNSGVDYILEDSFDVISVLDGTVTNVKEDDLVGKTIEIKHSNNYVTNYQSLSEVSVKKGDVVTQGQVIGKSGTAKIAPEMKNHLHFELYINGEVVNPENYVDKQLQNDKNTKKDTTTTQDNTTTNNTAQTDTTTDTQTKNETKTDTSEEE